MTSSIRSWTWFLSQCIIITTHCEEDFPIKTAAVWTRVCECVSSSLGSQLWWDVSERERTYMCATLHHSRYPPYIMWVSRDGQNPARIKHTLNTNKHLSTASSSHRAHQDTLSSLKHHIMYHISCQHMWSVMSHHSSLHPDCVLINWHTISPKYVMRRSVTVTK